MTAVLLYGVLNEGPVRVTLDGNHQHFDTLYGDLELGIYTAFRSFRHNRFLDLDTRLTRTRTAMQRFGLQQELDTRRLCRALHEVCTAYPGQDMRVRIDVLPEPALARGVNSTELIALAPFEAPDPGKYLRGVSVMTTQARDHDGALSKAADLSQTRATLMAHPDIEDCLIVNERGLVLEGSNSNFYALLDGVLHTAGEDILEGITRGALLDLSARMGHEVCTTAVAAQALHNATEAAISSSSRGLMPVVRIDGKPVGTGKPGPLMRSLHTAYAAYVSRNVRPAVRSQ